MTALSATDGVLQTDFLSPEFDWQSGRIRFPLSQENGETCECSFMVCGGWMPRGTQWRAMLEDPAGFYGDLLPVLQDANPAILNLEGVLMDQDLPPIAKDDISVPFHLACLANNHSFDYGRDGLVHMQQLLERHNVQFVGAGLSIEEATSARTFKFGVAHLAIVNPVEGEGVFLG